MKLAAVAIVLLFALSGAKASTAGLYSGAGESKQETRGECIAQGPTVVELRQNLNDSWSFDAHMHRFPDLDCNRISVGTVSFLSVLESDDLSGTPETGFTAAGVYHLNYPDQDVVWDLVVGPLGLETTWSIHFDTVAPGFGPRQTWWNGTAAFVGAHV